MKSTTLKTLLSTPIIAALALTSVCKKNEDKAEPSSKIVDTVETTDYTQRGPEPAREGVTDKVEETGEALQNSARNAKDEVVSSTRKTLDSLRQKIDEIEADAERQGEEFNGSLQASLEALKQERAELSAELERAGDVSEDKWDDFINETQQAMEKLEAGYNSVLEDMKSE